MDARTPKRPAGRPRLPALKPGEQAVLDAVRDAGPAGLTDRDLTRRFLAFNDRSTWRTRRAKLTKAGLVVWSGRWLTEGRSAHRVWIVPEYRDWQDGLNRPPPITPNSPWAE